MPYADRVDAWRTFIAAFRSNNATLTTTMATVSANSITAQNITDINAAIAAIAAAVVVLNGPILTRDHAQ